MDPHAKPDFETPAGREARYGEFVSLLARHDQSIRRFVRSLLPSNQGVDDVMQETALECWKKYESFTPDNAEDAVDEFIRWACVIARYKVLSWQRDSSRDRLVFRESVIERLAQDAMQNLEQRERERKAIETCLGQLDADQRRLVLSVHSPGESIAKIAEETGVKTRRLYSKVNALRKRLLDCVQGRLVEEL
ncbi:RNA polymerase factor sigma-70 [Rhodopirellula sp. SM50]|nr:sigma-70 family RNA polymerase sigma factor [Rhodopirellula sp. SM50]PAY19686.1 RNA polymerase factor sigma-70 [Rhodopirellula sp. SM50]